MFMYLLKKLSIVIFIISVLILIPDYSYAIADLSAFGGYSFGGKLKSAGTSDNLDGWQYGLYGHLNTGIPMLFTVGLGGFYQIAPLSLKTSSGTVDATKTAVGIDAYGQLDLPIIPVKPYLRYGLAVNEKYEVKYSGGSTNYSKNFNSNYYGIGLCYPIFSLVKFDLQLFAEYLYTTSKQENGVKINGNTINIGIKASI